MDKKVLIGGVVCVIVGVASFYAGAHVSAQGSRGSAAFSPNGAGRGAFMRTGTGGAFGASGAAREAAASGTVIAKDAHSITVQLADGSGSKIVLVATSTPVVKSTESSLADVSVGAAVSVTGESNQDGSITAQVVRLGEPRGGAFGQRRQTSGQ